MEKIFRYLHLSTVYKGFANKKLYKSIGERQEEQ